MRRVLQEPLLHFMILGGLLFLLNSRLGGGGDEDANPRKIGLGAAEIEWLREGWERRMLRPPTDAEFDDLLSEHLKEKLLAREAEVLGLAEDDTVIRRRLAQKMSFLIQDTARLEEPDEAELKAFFEAGAHRYAAPALVSFEHLYFSSEKRGADQARAAAAALLPRLLSGEAAAAGAGDPSVLPESMEDAEERQVAEQFGPDFARSLANPEPGDWTGPVDSAFGAHLVRVTNRRAGEPPSFAGAKEKTREDWWRDRQRKAERDYLESLLKRYEIAADEAVKARLAALSFAEGDR